MGWDDNGLPTERRVQNYYGVRGDASLPHDRGLPAAAAGRRRQEHQGGRPAADQPARTSSSCATCSPSRTRRPSSRSSARLGLSRRLGHHLPHHRRPLARRPRSRRSCATSRRGEAYQAEAPGLWDVTFQTAVAQAELEARDYPGALPPGGLPRPGRRGPVVHIETTRPELHPGGAWRSSPTPTTSATPALFGTTVTSPLFGVEVPVLAHPAAEPDKGAGIAMCCTFGDLTDVQWWRELQLPTRSVITAQRPDPARDARVDHRRPGRGAVSPSLAGKTTFSARAAVVDALRESGDLDGEPAADPAQGELLREGRQAAGDRHLAPVVHPQRRPRRRPARRSCVAARRGARLPPLVHAHPLRELGRAASTATG